MRETWGSNTLDFFYDAQGTPYAVKYNGTLYYYITNLQGDVLHITNSSGTTVVSYTYDPYGKPLTTTGSLASTLGAANPLRYRGYYFDSETGYYYLQSRYYDPEIGRFINADSYASTGQGIIGTNMFAYCLNNPVNLSDSKGTIPFYDDPTTKAIEDFIRWYWETDENKTDDNGRPTIDASIKKAINTLLYCFDFSLGIGMGYYVGTVVFDIGIEGGMYGNLISFEYSDGKFKYGQDMTDAALIVTIFQEELGFLKSAFKENGGIYEDRSWKWVNSDKDSWTIFSESIYVMVGFSFSIGFDIETFCHRMNEIVEAYR